MKLLITVQNLKNKTMSSYYLKRKKIHLRFYLIDLRFSKTSNNETMLSSKRALCGGQKSRFIEKQKASGIWSSLDLKTPLTKIPLFGDTLFWM